MIEQSEQLNEFATALAKAQLEIKTAAKDAVNPHFGSKYADLPAIWEALREAIGKNGIAIIQMPMLDHETGMVVMSTMLIHSSGLWIRSSITAKPRDLAPQSIGSAISYLRRYGLASMAGVVADQDDDANGAQPFQTSKPAAKTNARPQAAPKPASPATEDSRLVEIRAHLRKLGATNVAEAKAIMVRLMGWKDSAKSLEELSAEETDILLNRLMDELSR